MRQLRRLSLLHVSAQLHYTTPTRGTMVPWTSATMDAVNMPPVVASDLIGDIDGVLPFIAIKALKIKRGEGSFVKEEKMEVVMVVKLILFHDLKRNGG
ncbi:hypothetical protein YC2023_033313 [Brassica napus]